MIPMPSAYYLSMGTCLPSPAAYKSQNWGGRDRRMPGACWPASLAASAGYRFSHGENLPQKLSYRVIEEDN